MATKRLLNNKDDFEEADELEDSEVPEMGKEETEFDDTELEEAPEPTETDKE